MIRFWLIYAIYFLVAALNAQEVPRVLNFSKNDYQGQSQNWSITQTPDYELIFGNGNGVLVYDGAAWRTLTLPNQQIVRSVAVDTEGRVFAGGFAEFGYWQRDDTGNYQYHSLSQNLSFPKVGREEIWHILVHQNHVYFQSFSSIYKYNYSTVTALNPPSNIMFLQPVGNRLLIQGLKKGLFELLPQDTFALIKGSEFLANAVVSTILPYKNSFLVGTTKNGVFKYENNQFSIWNTPFQTIAKDFELNKGIALSNGHYAFGTILNGVYVTNTGGGIQFHINQENGLQNNTVLSMFEDASQNLWLGLDKGIDLIDLTTPLTFFQDKSGKIGSVYAAALYDKRLYVGTNQGVFYRKEGNNNFQLLKGLQGQAWDLQIFDNQLLCGHNSGSFIIKKDNSIQKIANETGGWCLIRHPSVSDVLVQSLYTGLALYKKNARGDWHFFKKIVGFGEPTKKIAFDANGTLWAISPYHQLYKIELNAALDSTKNVEQMHLPTTSKPFFNRVGDKLIFSNNDGAYYFDNATHSFKPYSEPTMAQQKGKWVQGIGRDLLKINANQLDIFAQNNPNAIVSLKIRLIADYETVVPLDSSRYLFGLDDGYAIFEKNVLSKSVSKQLKPIKPIVRIYTKNGQSFHFYTGNQTNGAISLPPQYRELRVAFALPNFVNPPAFSYALSEHMRNWSEWTSVPYREFANLSAGKHAFELLCNGDAAPTTITFDIKPYWYETVYAQLLLFLLIVGVGFWLNKYHNYQLEKQRKKLETEKEKELEQQRIKIENEQLQSEVKAKSKELANSTMNIIQKNEVLVEIKTELDTMKTGLPEKHYNHLSHLIDVNLTHEESAKIFEDNFNEVHEDFLKRLKHACPSLTPSDLKLAAYLRMNLSSKEISPLLFISVRSIENKRSRLRKKIGLSESDNLTAFLMQY